MQSTLGSEKANRSSLLPVDTPTKHICISAAAQEPAGIHPVLSNFVNSLLSKTQWCKQCVTKVALASV